VVSEFDDLAVQVPF